MRQGPTLTVLSAARGCSDAPPSTAVDAESSVTVVFCTVDETLTPLADQEVGPARADRSVDASVASAYQVAVLGVGGDQP